jgi:hypothetical protein
LIHVAERLEQVLDAAHEGVAGVVVGAGRRVDVDEDLLRRGLGEELNAMTPLAVEPDGRGEEGEGAERLALPITHNST